MKKGCFALFLIGILFLSGGLCVFLLWKGGGFGQLWTQLLPSGGTSFRFDTPHRLPYESRLWTGADGKSIEAVLVSAGPEWAQLRLPADQTLHTLRMDQFSPLDREEVQNWLRREGRDGVAGWPVTQRQDPWPKRWLASGEVGLQRDPSSGMWHSEHFAFEDRAGVEPAMLQTLAAICESVDGALAALPLPLDWGRPEGERRVIILDRDAITSDGVAAAGFFEGSTGKVKIDVTQLDELDVQAVVFEPGKPEKRQKYDTIVHEVVHQSMAPILYLDLPAWIPEGLAEYLAAMQQAPAKYYFNGNYASVRHHINKRLVADRVIKERTVRLAYLEDFLSRDIDAWNAVLQRGQVQGPLQYDQALLLVDFFCHADARNGAHFRQYLEAVLSGAPEREARETHLIRERGYRGLEAAMAKYWRPLGYRLVFQEKPELKAEDFVIDGAAEDIIRRQAAERMSR